MIAIAVACLLSLGQGGKPSAPGHHFLVASGSESVWFAADNVLRKRGFEVEVYFESLPEHEPGTWVEGKVDLIVDDASLARKAINVLTDEGIEGLSVVDKPRPWTPPSTRFENNSADPTNNRLPHIVLRNTPIREALKKIFLGLACYHVEPDVSGRVSLNMGNVRFEAALRAILNQVDATYRTSGCYMIMRRDPPTNGDGIPPPE